MKSSSLKMIFLWSAVAAASCTGACLGQSAGPSSPMSVLDGRPWEVGPTVAGGFGVGDRASYHFFNAGAHLGKVLTPTLGPGLLRGQFEYAAEIDPYWQAFTPAPHLQRVRYKVHGQPFTAILPYGGGTFSGASVTPIILRWNFRRPENGAGTHSPGGRTLVPWIQGAGGLIWTNHKFPPDILVAHGSPGGTSVFNFTPQFGVGFNYFVAPRRSLTFAANAVHISSASLGDRNPGVNASVLFQLGFSWWK